MAPKSDSDKRYLERHGDRWRVVVAVPRRLHKVLGTKLKRALPTDSLTVANKVKWSVVEELKDEIDRASGKDPVEYAQVMREAVRVRAELKNMSGREEDEERRLIAERATEILGPAVATIHDEEFGSLPAFDKGREALARNYMAVAQGQRTPIDTFLQEYKKTLKVKPRTANDLDRAMERLRRWLLQEGVPDDLKAVTTKVAKQFTNSLFEFEGGLRPATVDKYVNRLKLFWNKMVYAEHLEFNPWLSVVVEKEKTEHGEQERAFTETEVAKLLMGNPSQKLRDVMMIGALTGARLDAIVDMKVGDAVDGCFTFKPQKREQSSRDVPIHPDLKEIVERRTKNKAPDEDFFPDYPRAKKNSLRERSFKTSNDFTAYRRSVGVDETVPGKRRALTNFHSFRRWFITKAERAQVDTDLIAAIVGHKRSGITLGRYSEGPEMRAARKAVLKIKLPPLDGSPIVEPRAMTPRKRSSH